MSKDKISDYSATANSNTDIGGINIDEGCAPSGINDAIRTLMKQLKDWQSGSQDVYIHPAGSASVPSITATGDTNTGIFFPAADTVGITTGGTERARVDSSGNLGLGVTPSAWATVKALQLNTTGSVFSFTNEMDVAQNVYYNAGNKYITNAAATIYSQSGGVHYWFNAPSGTAGNAISFTQAMTLDASGNLGVGTTSPSGRLDVVNASTNSFLNVKTTNSGSASGISIVSNSNNGFIGYNGDLRFGTVTDVNAAGFTERARIDSSGNLLVGTTTVGETTSVGVRARPDGVLRSTRVDTVNTASTLDVYSTGASAYRFYVGMAGTVYATSTTITAISDQRFKENIRDLDDGLDVVMALKPRKFDWKEGKGQNIKDARGFIAQEFEQVLPDMVEEWRDPAPEGEEPYKAVNANLIPTLVKAIQEQQAIITALTARIEALEQA